MQQPVTAPIQPALHPDTTMGLVALTVADLARSARFYSDVLGFTVLRRSAGPGRAGRAGAPRCWCCTSSRARRPRRPTPPASIISPSWCPPRADLARSLLHLAESGYPLGGASDHLVSEALYLSDPDGNGIEIYRDRPRAEWPRRNGAAPDGDRSHSTCAPCWPRRRPTARPGPGLPDGHPPGPHAPAGRRHPARRAPST